MSDAKVKCADCGVALLPRTAEIFNGHCAFCYDARNPEFDSTQWDAYFEELPERLCREWAPRLRAYAEECRKVHLPPSDDSLSISDREKQRIYEAKLSSWKLEPGVDLALCCMPLLAIPIAQRLWPHNERTVLLTQEEYKQWHDVYCHPDDEFQWWTEFLWNIHDFPERDFSIVPGLFQYDKDDLKDSEVPWIVSVGHISGPLFGWGYWELWSWDGQHAEFVNIHANWIS